MRYGIYTYNGNDMFGIESVGFSNNTQITRFGPAQRNNYIIYYVISGRGYFNTHTVKKGQGFLITPGMSEHYYPAKENPREFLWIIFGNNSANSKIFKEYNANPQTNIFEYNNMLPIIQLKETIIKNNNAIYSAYELFEMFLRVFNSHNIGKIKTSDAETTYFQYAVNFIKSNYFRKITIGELTDILGISQPYLYRIFIKKCSLSPKNYIDELKIQKAKELLLKSSVQISEIAKSVGMEDSVAFSKFFKNKIGISPSEFRKNNV